MRRIAEEDLRYKSYPLKIRQMLSETGQIELLLWLSFWPPNSPDLNLLNYYVWNVIERITNNVCVSWYPNVIKDAIEAAFVDMRYIIACERFRLRMKAVKLKENISNNCALQGSPKCPCKRIFCNIYFFIKNILFKEIVQFVRILVTHTLYIQVRINTHILFQYK